MRRASELDLLGLAAPLLFPSGRTGHRSAAGSAAPRAWGRGRSPCGSSSCIILSASFGSRQKMRNAWSKIGRCSWRESSTADMVQYQSSRRSGNSCAPAISSACTQSITRSEPMRKPAARSRRAKCITFSARRPAASPHRPCLFRRRRAALARQLLHRRRGDDRVLAEVALVVALDLGEPVHVVHHQAGRARHALLGGVAHPVQALERAPLPRWKRATGSSGSLALLGVQQVARAQAHQQVLCKRLGGPRRRCQAGSSICARRQRLRILGALPRASARNPGIGESVAKRRRCGNSRLSSSATCLISRLPNEMPRSPSWQLVIE